MTSVGEFWDVKFWTAVGDEEYVHLRTLFIMFSLRTPVFIILRRNPLGDVYFA